MTTINFQVYGLHLVKLAVLLTVITGSNHIIDSEKKNVDGSHTTRVRGQCHLLLVGDPGNSIQKYFVFLNLKYYDVGLLSMYL